MNRTPSGPIRATAGGLATGGGIPGEAVGPGAASGAGAAGAIALIDGPVGQWPGPLTVLETGAEGEAGAAARGHAQAMADALAAGGGARGRPLINAVVFGGRLTTRLACVLAAIDVLLEWPEAIDLVHCSFGLARPDAALMARLDALTERVGVVVASAPARGAMAWPAAHPAVVSVQGDARCLAGQWSHLGLAHAQFGADPRDASGQAGAPAGASLAAARFSGLALAHCPVLRGADVRARMAALANWHGRERRGGPGNPAV